MDHGEDIKSAIAREMKEEVNLVGNFTYKIIAVDEPALLRSQNFWQIRLIFKVKPQDIDFSAGDDGDEVVFMPAAVFKDSGIKTERQIYGYASLL